MPRPGTALIDPRTLPALAGVAARSMTATGRLERPASDAPTLDPDTDQLVPAEPTVVWTGPCRVQPHQTRATDAQVGEQAVALRLSDVDLPAAVDVHVGDVLVVTAAVDSGLVGRHLVVMEVEYSSLEVLRRAIVQDQLG